MSSPVNSIQRNIVDQIAHQRTSSEVRRTVPIIGLRNSRRVAGYRQYVRKCGEPIPRWTPGHPVDRRSDEAGTPSRLLELAAEKTGSHAILQSSARHYRWMFDEGVPLRRFLCILRLGLFKACNNNNPVQLDETAKPGAHDAARAPAQLSLTKNEFLFDFGLQVNSVEQPQKYEHHAGSHSENAASRTRLQVRSRCRSKDELT